MFKYDMRRAVYIIVLLSIISPSVGKSQPWWSVGPKLGYTLGDNGGFTWGMEVTYFPHQIFPFWGFTCDFTYWNGHFSIHTGIEADEIIGLDVGPTLFYWGGTFHGGLSIIPFCGIIGFVYYELAWPFFEVPFQSWGGYLKIPIGLNIGYIG